MEYRNLKICERALASDLFQSYYDSNVYCTERRYFDWLHIDNPLRLDHVEADECTVLAAVDDHRLAGCIHYVPTRVSIDGSSYSAAVTTESLARAEAGGVYGLLARRLNGRFDYCFTMGATPFLRDLYVNQLGATYRHEIDRGLLVGDVDALQRILAAHPQPTSADAGLLRTWADDARRLAEGRTWHRIDSAESLCDAYWQDLLASGIPCTLKDPAWLTWRYFGHPHLDYQVISATDCQSSGLAVIRHEPLAAQDCQVLRVLEFLPTAQGDAELAAAVASYALDMGCAFVDFFCADKQRMERLPSAFVRLDSHRYLNIPYLTQPLEWRERRSINLLSTRNRRKRKVLPKLNGTGIYITKGDGAQDVALDRGYRSAHLREPSTSSN